MRHEYQLTDRTCEWCNARLKKYQARFCSRSCSVSATNSMRAYVEQGWKKEENEAMAKIRPFKEIMCGRW